MLINLVANIVGALIFLFVLWKRLKEDYSAEIIYATGFYMLSGLVLGLVASFYISPGWWFWFSFLGLSLGFVFPVLKFKLRFYETLEASTVGLILWLLVMFLWHAVVYANVTSLLGGLVLAAILLLFFFMDRKYKGFSWYTSGRVGFSGMTTLGVFFLTRALFASYSVSVLSLTGKWDAILSSVIGFTAFLLVYNLSRKVA